MIIATILVAISRLPVETSLLTIIQIQYQSVEELKDEGKDRDVQILALYISSIVIVSAKSWRQSSCNNFRCLQYLEDKNSWLSFLLCRLDHF